MPTMKMNGIHPLTLDPADSHQDTVPPLTLLTIQTCKAKLRHTPVRTRQVITPHPDHLALPDARAVPLEPDYPPHEAPEGRKAHQAPLVNKDDKVTKVRLAEMDSLAQQVDLAEALEGHQVHLDPQDLPDQQALQLSVLLE